MDYERNVASSLREDVDALQLQLQEAENKFDELKKKHDEVLKVVRRTAKVYFYYFKNTIYIKSHTDFIFYSLDWFYIFFII